MRRWIALIAGAVLGAASGGAGAAPAPAPDPIPKRVVSVNPCTDAILLDVADPGQIVALSLYSRQPSQSAVWRAARRFPATGGSGEEIVALRPDLVLGAGLDAAELAHVLPRLHIRQDTFPVPETVTDSEAQVRRIAALVGHPERGAALNARIEAALAAAAPPPGEPRLRALIYEGQGMASGPRTLIDELMRRAGFDNLAARYGLSHTMSLPLERVIADPPQVLLSGRMAPGEPTWADRVLSHPALRHLTPHMLTESFPAPLLFCAGPVMIPAIAALERARIDAERGVSR
jgi:iron complex transport system substrate-binding protein